MENKNLKSYLELIEWLKDNLLNTPSLLELTDLDIPEQKKIILKDSTITEDQDIVLTIYLENLNSSFKLQNHMNTFDNFLVENIGKVDDTQVSSARNLIKSTLKLEEGSTMDNIVDSFVTDISKTINDGIPFKDIVSTLSDSFGKTIQGHLNSGSLSMNDIQGSTRQLMDCLSDPSILQGTAPQNSDPSTVLQRRLNKNRATRRAEQLLERKRVKKNLKKK